jgi:hypothetical protein
MPVAKIPSRALLLMALVSAGACSWLKPKSEYDGVELTPPLTIPADLSKPRDRDALRIPAKSLIGANAVKTDIVRNFNVNMGVADAWKRLGQLLPAIEGVSVLNSVESISSHEVRYADETFLITAQDNAGKIAHCGDCRRRLDQRKPGLRPVAGAVAGEILNWIILQQTKKSAWALFFMLQFKVSALQMRQFAGLAIPLGGIAQRFGACGDDRP